MGRLVGRELGEVGGTKHIPKKTEGCHMHVFEKSNLSGRVGAGS